MTDKELDILAAKLAERIVFQPRWLKLRQAATYSSIGQKKLIELAESREINGFRHKALGSSPWVFDKESIDAYMLDQVKVDHMDIEEMGQFAIEIVESLDI